MKLLTFTGMFFQCVSLCEHFVADVADVGRVLGVDDVMVFQFGAGLKSNNGHVFD